MASSTTTASDDSGGAPPAAHPATLRSVSFEAAAGVAKHMEAGTPGSESVTSSSNLRRARMLDSALGGGGFASTRHLLSSKTSLGGDGWGSSSQQFRGIPADTRNMFTWVLGCYLLVACLGNWQFSAYVCAAAATLLAAMFQASLMDGHMLVVALLRFCLHLFFRRIESRGRHRVPGKGPVLFVCGPHANQFLDPLVVVDCCPHRDVGFLAAAASVRRPFVGALIRAMGSIPVERPQDVAVPGSGTITITGKSCIGIGTKFTTEAQAEGASISAKGNTLRIMRVVSDTELELRTGSDANAKQVIDSKYKIVPKLSHEKAFASVISTFARGACVGIFPEGGSHDRASLLPLKAGAAIMALQYALQHPEGEPLTIVPAGLTYFQGHKFRGRAVVDFGTPLHVPSQLVDEYAKGGSAKHDAINKLLGDIQLGLEAVTVNAPDWETLQLVWAVRRLALPSSLGMGAAVSVTRRFLAAYEAVRDQPEVAALRSEVAKYNAALEDHGLRDNQVTSTALGGARAAWLLVFRVVLFLVYIVVALPGGLLNAPVIIAAPLVAKRKAQAAVAKSSVKLEGRDVLATWKMLVALVLVPLSFVVYLAIVACVAVMKGWPVTDSVCVAAIVIPAMSYISMRVVETEWALLRSFKPLVLSLSRRGSVRELQAKRAKLAERVQKFVTRVVAHQGEVPPASK